MISIGSNLCATQKPWGLQATVSLSRATQLDICQILVGGFSSRHLHQRKSNEFLCAVGQVQLLIFGDCVDNEPKLIYLHGHTPTWISVEPGSIHQFIAREPSILVERYRSVTTDPVDPSDIIRFDGGGLLKVTDHV